MFTGSEPFVKVHLQNERYRRNEFMFKEKYKNKEILENNLTTRTLRQVLEIS